MSAKHVSASAPIPIVVSILILIFFKQAIGVLIPNRYCMDFSDLYRGNWVFDDSYPLYNSSLCPFIEKPFDCRGNGRPDTEYLKFSWKPTSCRMPRFNAERFLTYYRGKQIMFVGDSLSLNQWQSLTCMLHSAIPTNTYTLFRRGSDSVFIFPVYNTTIIYSRNALLADVTRNEANQRVLNLDSLSSSQKWGGMDVLIFDTWHWWLHTGRKQSWDIVGDERYENASRVVLYEKALMTWAKWVETSVNTYKTKIFFQGVSPDHWNCTDDKVPLKEEEGEGGVSEGEKVLEKVIQGMSKKIYLLNITRLSYQRVDGHPSIYGLGGHRGMDCTHWCLPGVPDIWNQFLFASIFPY